jgi:uncharacterized protein (TIGR02996 family)
LDDEDWLHLQERADRLEAAQGNVSAGGPTAPSSPPGDPLRPAVLAGQDPLATVEIVNATAAESPATNGPFEAAPTVSCNGYRLEELIVRGYHQIWRAVAADGSPVAIKIVRRSDDHEERLREERDLRLRQQLNHPSLLKIIATWSDEERLYLVMELTEGSLRDRLRQRKAETSSGIPVEELLPIFRQAAEGLDYLHSQGVLHRDVKPDQLLLVGRNVRLAGFDLRHAGQDGYISAGTPAYMAPEVWRDATSKHSDQYSLACTYAEMRLGHRAFTGTDYASVMLDHLDNTPNLEPLPDEEKQVLHQALAKNAEARYSSCLAFVTALEEALGLRSYDPQESAFLAAIRDNPDDDVTRLVYADWLDEHDDIRGEIVRLEVQLADLPLTDSRFTLLRQHLQDLVSPQHRGWLRHIVSSRQSKIPNWEAILFEPLLQPTPVKRWWQFWRR